MDILAGILLAAGLFFLAISCLGLIRLPDFYTRNHAAGKLVLWQPCLYCWGLQSIIDLT